MLNVDTTSWEVISTYDGNVEKAYNNELQQHNRKWRNSAKLVSQVHKMDQGDKVMRSGSNASSVSQRIIKTRFADPKSHYLVVTIW